MISDTRLNKCRLRHRVGINVSMLERLFHSFTGIYIFECSDLLTMFINLYLDHFPAKVDLYSTLVALIEGNIISIWELEYLFIWSPVLNLGIR